MSEFASQATTLHATPDFALLADTERKLSRRGVATFSNLDDQYFARFRQVWQKVPRERRVEIVQTLHTLAEENIDLNFRPIFLLCLDDADAHVRAVAIDGLWEDERPGTLRRLLAMLDDTASEVRVTALLSLSRFAYRAELGEINGEDTRALHAALLRIAADDMQPLDAQRRAVESLGYFAASPEAQAAVGRAYHHESLRMRESAVIAMGRSMRPDWYASIEHELGNPLPALRFAAAQAVGELGEDGEALLPRLLPLIEDDDDEVMQMAIWALGQVASQHSQRVLQRLRQSQNEIVRQAAYAALAEITFELE